MAGPSQPGHSGDPHPTASARTFRPLWARRVIYPLAAVVLGAFAFGAASLPAGTSLSDRAAFVVFALVLDALLFRLAAVRVETDPNGLLVVNFVRCSRLAWAQIVDVRLGKGDPWVTLDLSDGETLAAMGIQGSDGDYAREQARDLGRLVALHSRTARND